MANKFEIPEEVETRLRRRDKKCVYCGKKMIYPYDSKRPSDSATIEHFREKGPFYWKGGKKGLKEEDLAICCGSCNSSRGRKKIRIWLREKNINEKNVAEVVKKYIRKNEK